MRKRAARNPKGGTSIHVVEQDAASSNQWLVARVCNRYMDEKDASGFSLSDIAPNFLNNQPYMYRSQPLYCWKGFATSIVSKILLPLLSCYAILR